MANIEPAVADPVFSPTAKVVNVASDGAFSVAVPESAEVPKATRDTYKTASMARRENLNKIW